MQKRIVIMKALAVFVILAISFGTVMDFSIRLSHILQQETYRTLSEVSEHYNKAFLERINSHIKMMNVIAGNLETLPNPTLQNTTQALQRATESSGLTRILLTDANGTIHSQAGQPIDVSQRDYWKRAMQGETVVSEPLRSGFDQEECLVLAVPVKSNGAVVGVLCGMYSLVSAGNNLLDNSYYSGGYGFILSRNGTIVLSSNHADKLSKEDNLLSFFEKTEFIDFSVDDLKTAMENGESGIFTFLYEGNKRFVSFTPSGVNDWYTISLASNSVMLQQESATTRLAFQLVLKLAIVGVMITAFIVLSKRRHNREIASANQRYQSLINNINGGVLVNTHSKEINQIKPIYISDGFSAMTSYTYEDINSFFDGEYIRILHADDRQAAFSSYIEQLATGNLYRMSYRIIKKDGSILWVVDTGYVIDDEQGKPLNHSILTDITVLKQQEEALRLSEERFRLAIKASHATLFEIDLQTKAFLHFENTETLLGFSPAQLEEITKPFSSMNLSEYRRAVKSIFFHPDDAKLLNKVFATISSGQSIHFETRMKCADKGFLWCKVDMDVISSELGIPLRTVGYVADISSIKRNTEFLENQAQIDPLTQLYNKAATASLINEILSDHSDSLHGLILLDIDNFKGVNDTLGHVFGDAVLMDVCAKLKMLFRSDDIVGRIGGDEFAILMKHVPDTNLVLKKAAEIGSAFRQTYAGENGDYKISCSMGIVLVENKDDLFETLYPKADAALYQAKRNGKDMFVLYRAEDAEEYPISRAKTNDLELHTIREHWNIEERIFDLLYNSRNFSDSVNMALAMIGRHYRVSRVYIFENDEANSNTSNTYEWCNQDIPAEMEHLQNIPISTEQGSLLDCFDENGLLYCNDIRALPPYTKHLLARGDILSTLQMEIVNEGRLGGFIGFDECREYRIWTSAEVDTLFFLSKILNIFLLKQKAAAALMSTLGSRLVILDSLPDYICVINPELHSIEYANNRMHELLPDAHSGAFCYTTLRGGQNAPCESCLVERIKRGDTDNLEIVSADKGIRLKVEALYIDWAQNQKMVLLHGHTVTSAPTP